MEEALPPREHKAAAVASACETRDLHALSRLACAEGGLLDDELRRTAWPLLLACKPDDESPSDVWASLGKHRDEHQVQLDVDRSFTYYPENESEEKLAHRRHELFHVITAVLRRHPALHYFQGYHDIIQVLLLVLGAEAAALAAARLSLLRIRDYMLPTMTGALSQLHLLPAVLQTADEQLYEHLSHTAPFFALAATLTLYAHDIQQYSDIARLFDFLLASEAVMSLYLFVAIILSRKKELLDIGPDEPEMLHFTLSKLPQPLDLEAYIKQALELFTDHPPESLPKRAWSRISANSVLKTTRDPRALRQQTLADGQGYFDRQAREIRWQEAAQRVAQRSQQLARRYQKPAYATSFAVLAAVLAYYLRRQSTSPVVTDLYVLGLGLRERAMTVVQHFKLLLR